MKSCYSCWHACREGGWQWSSGELHKALSTSLFYASAPWQSLSLLLGLPLGALLLGLTSLLVSVSASLRPRNSRQTICLAWPERAARPLSLACRLLRSFLGVSLLLRNGLWVSFHLLPTLPLAAPPSVFFPVQASTERGSFPSRQERRALEHCNRFCTQTKAFLLSLGSV